jgi:hypothetical protein
MKPRLSLMMASVVAMGLGLGVAHKYLADEPGNDFLDPTAWRQGLGTRNPPDLTAPKSGFVVMERMAMKEAIVRKLIGGEITLEQAAARFLEICSRNKAYFVGLDCTYPDLDRNEAVYRNLMEWVAKLHEKQPEYPSIQQRLEQDFERCRQQNFPLPPIPLQAQAACE